MLLDEDPATLIHHTIGNFNIHPDKLAVSRINESLATLQQARDLRIRESESALKKLSRTLTALNSHHKDLVESHSATQHASEIATLDTNKFRVAKTASDLEIESERLASQLADLQARLQELELQGPEGGSAAGARRLIDDDQATLRLKIYRSMGMEVDYGGQEGAKGGEYNRVVIRNLRDGKSDMHVVKIEEGKYSRQFYAKYLWDRM